MNSRPFKVARICMWVLLGMAMGTMLGNVAFKNRQPRTDRDLNAQPIVTGTDDTSTDSLFARLVPPGPATLEAASDLLARQKSSHQPQRMQHELAQIVNQLAADATNAPTLLNLVLQGDNVPAVLVSTLFEKWQKSDHQAAFNAMEALPTAKLERLALKGLMRSWAKSDPDAAIDHYLELPASRARDLGLLKVTMAIAKDDPQRALDKAAELQIGFIQDAVYNSFAQPLDYDDAVNWIRTIDSPTLRRELHNRALTRLADNNIDRAIEETLNLKESVMRADILRFLLGRMTDSDTEMAAKYLATIPLKVLPAGILARAGNTMGIRDYDEAMTVGKSLPEARRSEFFAGVLQSVHATAHEDPDHYANRVNEYVAPGAQRNKLYARTAKEWCRKDPHLVAAWLTKLPLSAERDHAIDAFASTLVQSDPLRAAQWAASISNPDLQESSLDGVLKQWREHDEAATVDWLNSLSDSVSDRH